MLILAATVDALSRARGFIEGARSALGELGAALGSVDPRVREFVRKLLSEKR